MTLKLYSCKPLRSTAAPPAPCVMLWAEGAPDVNVRLAAAWSNHRSHSRASDWFDTSAATSWATTPFTEVAFVRLSSNLSLQLGAVPPREGLAGLRRLGEFGDHEFWGDDARLVSASLDTLRPVGHRQATDLHLLEVCRRRGGRLVTFDSGLRELLPTA